MTSSVDLRSALSSDFEITYKRDKSTGEFLSVKARLCIHGNEVEKYDFDDAKSPTARIAGAKILFALLTNKTSQGKARAWDVTGGLDVTRDLTQRERKTIPLLTQDRFYCGCRMAG